MLLQKLSGKLLIISLALLIPETNLAEAQIVFENEDDNQVQTRCRTPEGRSGACVRLTSCTFLIQTVKRNRLHQYLCGFEGDEPMVCCSTSSTRVLEDGITARPTRITTRRTTPRTTRPTTRRPTRRTTIRSDREPRIGGEDIVETRMLETTLRPSRTQMDEMTKPSFLPRVVFENDDDNQVQTRCRTPEGRSGACVRLISCTFLIQTVKRNRLHQYLCGFKGNEPMVCCSMSSTRVLEDGITARPTRITTRRTTTRTTRPSTRRPTVRTTIQSDREPRIGGEDIVETRMLETTLGPTRTQMDEMTKPPFLRRECGVSNNSHTRIVNGTPAPPGSWPWFAVIFVRMANGVQSPDCGGALVTRRHVVTAAHCLVDLNKKNISPSRLSVRLGTYDLSLPNAPGTVNIGVEDVRTHEQYARQTYKNDIAVLKLSRPATFTETVAPVCLPYDSVRYKDLTDRSVWIAGFGTTSFNGKASKILLEASIKVQNETICKKAYRDLLKTELTSVYMCAGELDGSKDACQGDSGGPLTAVGENNNFYLVGIVSFGKQCGKPGYPGVYMRVTEFLDWLKEKLSY